MELSGPLSKGTTMMDALTTTKPIAARAVPKWRRPSKRHVIRSRRDKAGVTRRRRSTLKGRSRGRMTIATSTQCRRRNCRRSGTKDSLTSSSIKKIPQSTHSRTRKSLAGRTGKSGKKGSSTVVGIWSEKLNLLADAMVTGGDSPTGTPKQSLYDQIPGMDDKELSKWMFSYGAAMTTNENGLSS